MVSSSAGGGGAGGGGSGGGGSGGGAGGDPIELTAVRGAGLETGSFDTATGKWSADNGGRNATMTVSSPGNPQALVLPDGRRASFAQAATTNADGSRRFSGSLTGAGAQVTLDSYQAASNLRYSDYGTWAVAASGAIPASVAVYGVGIPTAQASMPTTGGATYQGGAAGMANIGGANYTFTGTTTLNADFAQGTVSGEVTNLQARTVGATPTAAGRMNDIQLQGGAISGNTFFGAAAPKAATPQTALNIGGTAGTYGGQFNGPAAEEVSGSFKLTGGADTVAGSFGARQ